MFSIEGSWKNVVNFKLMFCFRWSRSCPELKDKLSQFAVKTEGLDGSLEIKSAKQGFSMDHRIPGTSMIYKCSDGFDLGEENNTNPDQMLSCQANLKVDFSRVAQCKRKKIFLREYFS